MMKISLILLSILIAGKAIACSCGTKGLITRYEYDNTKFIFIGKVEEVIVHPKDVPEGMIVMATSYELVFKPIKIYKGTPDSSGRFALTTNAQSSACGVSLDVGEYILVFSNGHLSKCGRYEQFKPNSKNIDSLQIELEHWVQHNFYDSVLTALGAPMPDGLYEGFDASGMVQNGKRQGRWDFTATYQRYIKAYNVSKSTYKEPIVASLYYTNDALDSSYYFSDGTVTEINRFRGEHPVGWQEKYRERKIESKTLYNEEGNVQESWSLDTSGTPYSHLFIRNGRYVEEYLEKTTGKPWQRNTSIDDVQRVELLDSLGKAYLVGSFALNESGRYYDNILSLGTYVNRQQDTLVKNGKGTFVDYYPNGQKRIEFFVEDGKISRQYMEWHANGRRKEQAYFLDKLPYTANSMSCNLTSDYARSFQLECFAYCKTNKAWYENGRRFYIKRYGRNGDKDEPRYRMPLLCRLGLKRVKPLELIEATPIRAVEEK